MYHVETLLVVLVDIDVLLLVLLVAVVRDVALHVEFAHTVEIIIQYSLKISPALPPQIIITYMGGSYLGAPFK